MGIDPISLAIIAVVSVAAATASTHFLTPKLKSPSTGNQPKGRSGNIRSAEAPQDLCFGYLVKGGVIAFINGTGTDNEYLHEFLIMAGGEIRGIGDVKFNGEVVNELSISPSHDPFINSYLSRVRTSLDQDAAPRYAPLIRINRHLGSLTQAADPDAVAENSQITADHRGAGLAYIYARLRNDPAIFTTFVPEITAEIYGSVEIHDPRANVERWTMNPALICGRILEIYGVDRSKIHAPTLIESANVCDEIVLDAAGNQELRYTANGYLEMDGDWRKALNPFITAMNGAVVEWDGIYYIYAGKWREPSLTITDADLMGAINRKMAGSEQDRANSVKGTFISPASYNTKTEFPSYQDAVALAQDSGRDNWLEIDLEMINTPTQAQRVANQYLRESRLDEVITMEVTLEVGLDLKPYDNVIYQSSIFGMSETYRVIGHSEMKRGTAFGVELTLKRHEPSVYEWNPSINEQIFINASTNLPGTGDARNPVNPLATLTSNPTGTSYAPGSAAMTWQLPASTAYTGFQIETSLQFESRLDGGAWVSDTISIFTDAPLGATSKAISFEDGTEPAGSYEFRNQSLIVKRIRSIYSAGSFGSWINFS